MKTIWFFVALCSCLLVAMPGHATSPIRLGMSAPLTGPAAELGREYQQGALLAFAQINQQGGIHGRPIVLLTADDGYEPVRTVENTRRFLQQDDVFALFGYVGTPTSHAALPLLRKYRRPFLMPFTGAELLRQPADEFIRHFRAGYQEEVAAQIRYLVDRKGLLKLALLIQADEFGASVEQHYLKELSQRGLRPVTTARFQRNSSDLAQAMQQLQHAGAEVVLTVGTYHALSSAIQLAQQQQYHPIYTLISFSGVSRIKQMLTGSPQIYATFVVPVMHDSHPLHQVYPQLQQINRSALSEISLEGFIAGRLVGEAMQRCPAPLTGACLLQQLDRSQLTGFSKAANPTRHQLSDSVYLYQLTPNGFTEVSTAASL